MNVVDRYAKSRARMTERNTTHGLRGSPEYPIWAHMVSRCTNPRHPAYARYGGRGITICQRWRDSFPAFLDDMGPRPEGERYTLERIDNEKGYEPGNCRWATCKEQSRNRRTNLFIEHAGLRLTLGDWAARTGLSRSCISRRIAKGWPPERALTTTPRKTRGHQSTDGNVTCAVDN